MATSSDWSSPSSWSAGGGGMMQMATPQQTTMMSAPQGTGGVGMNSMPYQQNQMAQAGMPMQTGGGMPQQSSQAFGMWGAPQQQPYGSPYGAYGGGMPYGMPAPYGAPYGAPGGYGGWSQSAVMPQGNQMGAPQNDVSTPQGVLEDFAGKINLSGGMTQNTTFTPWTPLGNRYEGLWAGKPGSFTGAEQELKKQQALGPQGFDPSSEAGLRRMEQLASMGNPFFAGARDAVTGITSGQNRINTGGMFSNMYNDPGITGMGQYQDMAHQNAIGNEQQYRNMIQGDAVGSDKFNQLYGRPGVSTGGYNDLYHQNAVDTGNYQNIMSGQGSLSGGMFGEVARGDRVNSNPYREQAISNAMNQASDATKAGMSARGRYGGSAYGDAMGKALGEVATTARMQGYDTDTANMMQAAQARSGEQLAAAGGIAGAQSGNFAGRLSALQGLTGAQSANIAQQQAAAQGLAGVQGTNAAQRLAQIQGLSGIQGQNYQAKLGALGQMNQAQQMANQQRQAAAQGLTGVQGQNIQNRMQAAGMAPAMNDLRYDDATRMMQAGAAREAMGQQQRDFGWNQLNQYRGMLGNLPGAAGQSQSQTQQPWWQTALGIGAGMGGIYGGMGGGG